LGKNIFEVSTNEKITDVLNRCKTEKISIIYESQTKSKTGDLMWVQTTLTPILDFENNISKFVAIETDIRKLKQYENQLQEKNEHITSSINYAQTIQKAILPLQEIIDNNFDNFIIFRPKDIVSGDFYWSSQINLKNNDFENGETLTNTKYIDLENNLKIKDNNNFSLITYHFIAVIDCTGHGVPGAFMSMIGNTLLNEIVNGKRIIETDEILNNLHKQIVISLRQEYSTNNDGMDLCLCRVEKNENDYVINFSGAKRPLNIYKSETNTLESIKGDRKGIGGVNKFQKTEFFTKNEIQLKQNDIIFLSSDGYTDQNNPERKKIGSIQLEKMILENIHKPMLQQGEIYNKALEDWMNGEPQRDDITLIGIKL